MAFQQLLPRRGRRRADHRRRHPRHRQRHHRQRDSRRHRHRHQRRDQSVERHAEQRRRVLRVPAAAGGTLSRRDRAAGIPEGALGRIRAELRRPPALRHDADHRPGQRSGRRHRRGAAGECDDDVAGRGDGSGQGGSASAERPQLPAARRPAGGRRQFTVVEHGRPRRHRVQRIAGARQQPDARRRRHVVRREQRRGQRHVGGRERRLADQHGQRRGDRRVQGDRKRLLRRIRPRHRRRAERHHQVGHEPLPRHGVRVLPQRRARRQQLLLQPLGPRETAAALESVRRQLRRPDRARSHLLLRQLRRRAGAARADRHRQRADAVAAEQRESAHPRRAVADAVDLRGDERSVHRLSSPQRRARQRRAHVAVARRRAALARSAPRRALQLQPSGLFGADAARSEPAPVPDARPQRRGAALLGAVAEHVQRVPLRHQQQQSRPPSHRHRRHSGVPVGRDRRPDRRWRCPAKFISRRRRGR